MYGRDVEKYSILSAILTVKGIISDVCGGGAKKVTGSSHEGPVVQVLQHFESHRMAMGSPDSRGLPWPFFVIQPVVCLLGCMLMLKTAEDTQVSSGLDSSMSSRGLSAMINGSCVVVVRGRHDRGAS